MARPTDMATFVRDAGEWVADQVLRGRAPADWGPILPPDRRDEGVAWQRALFEAGYAALDWPEAWGGRGLTAEHRAAWYEICARAGVPAVLNMVGLVLTADVLLAFGTDEQRGEHLPPTARGERVWCQLFSEPDAGSDLASLRTTATAEGDGWIVRGQKVWCSGGRIADWGILLARTDADAPKHRGISFFVVDMRSAGIDVRPLRQMTGDAEFDEVFFDNVHLPATALVGPLHGGWGVAMAALTSERGFIGAATVALGRRLDALVESSSSASVDRVTRDRLAALVARGRALQALGSRQGADASVASSLMKLGMTELSVAAASAGIDLVGADGMLDGDAARTVVASPGARLGGGTSEVQRNIIGELVLGLPKEPKPPSPAGG